MWRRINRFALALALFAVVNPANAQSRAAKIASALASAPASVSKDATVKDWPDSAGNMVVLRAGSNGWVCFPSHPKSKYVTNDAMCLDEQMQEWMAAMVAQRKPNITTIGYSYMLTADEWVSNNDMAATGPTPTNQWFKERPHVMMVYPEGMLLDPLPTKPSTIGPFVMNAGTPYAHVMWPMR
ncbi:MAG: hypothetical protein ACJ785_08565 [Gemmatimonadaceae bacterium]